MGQQVGTPCVQDGEESDLCAEPLGNRCPLHRRPRIHIGIGHHCPPSHLDYQGAPGSGLHRFTGHEPPLRRRRDSQRNPAHDRHCAARKGPAPSADIRRIVAARREDLLGLRSATLVLVGFAGGFRRSELAGIHIYDLKFSTDGVVVTVRKSKTDQEAAGREVGLPFGANPRHLSGSCIARLARRGRDHGKARSSGLLDDTDMYRGAACTKIQLESS